MYLKWRVLEAYELQHVCAIRDTLQTLITVTYTDEVSLEDSVPFY